MPTEDRIRESYALLGALEATAVRFSAESLPGAIDELRGLVTALASEGDKARQYELDHSFHRRLIRDCGNDRLLQVIEAERVRAERFDGGRQRGTFDQEGSCKDHLAIVSLIEQSQIEAAAQLLEAHWRRGIGIVTSWLGKGQ
jgi:DNA-binding GntR family transcriptional regulator